MEKKPYKDTNVIDMFTRKPINDSNLNKIVRLAPELDGIEMLYSNDSNPNKIFSMKILCWALMKNGEVDALVPWLDKVVPARELNDPLNGHWEGYYDNFHNQAYFSPPPHKITELKSANSFFNTKFDDKDIIIQEITDTIGTHAALTDDQLQTLVLANISTWRLYNDGRLHAMIADEKQVETTPILIGDECLYSAQDNKNFRYFFHHIIANKIKMGDPDAIAALTHMV